MVAPLFRKFIQMRNILFLVVLLMAIPFITPNNYVIYILALTFLFSVVALGFDIMVGRLGMFNFGHAALFGAGGYTSALLAKYLGVPVPLSIIIGGVAACIIGMPIGMVGLRLHGAYFAIATLALSEILRLTYLRILDPWTYGESGLWGIPGFPNINLGSITLKFSTSLTLQYFLFLFFMLLTIFFFKIILDSKIGLYFKAIRQDEEASKSLGINVVRYKLIGFMISSFFTGLAGSLYAHWLETFSPSLMTIAQTVFYLSMILIGGVRSIAGPIIGAFINVILLELLKFTGFHYIIFGMIVILVIILWPHGIAGSEHFMKLQQKILGYIPK